MKSTLKYTVLALTFGLILTGCNHKNKSAQIESMKTQLAAQEILLQTFQQQIGQNAHNIALLIQKVDPEAAKALAEQAQQAQAEKSEEITENTSKEETIKEAIKETE